MFKAITTVYSYYMPEIRDTVDQLVRVFPHEIFLKSVTPGLDNFHIPIIHRLVDWYHDDVPALKDFAHSYPTTGSEEFIREYMTSLQAHGVTTIYIFKGDYEGYREIAKTRGIETREVPFESDPQKLSPGHWFISNPSARDGMIIPDMHIQNICNAGHSVFYDLSYLGSTDPHVFDVSHKNIKAVAISFSKPFGLFYYRIGFGFAREAIPALYANKWFKNIFNLLLVETMMKTLDKIALAKKYKAMQKEIIEEIRKETSLPIEPCDTFLLARIPAEHVSTLSPNEAKELLRFYRGEGYRFCLTPYFQDRELYGGGARKY